MLLPRQGKIKYLIDLPRLTQFGYKGTGYKRGSVGVASGFSGVKRGKAGECGVKRGGVASGYNSLVPSLGTVCVPRDSTINLKLIGK